MDAVPHLEDYLRTARIVHSTDFGGGGGHQNKQLVLLDGGLGTVAKLAEGPDVDRASFQVRSEVAAWVLASELGWADMVPTTALRVVRSRFTGALVAASVQVLWPRFRVAADLQKTFQDCEERDRWRVAIFDALSANPDRNEGNWGFIDGLDTAKLIDHGHAFDPGQAVTTSPFATDKRGSTIPPEYLERVHAFTGTRRTALSEVLDENMVEVVRTRARTLVQGGTLAF